MTRRPLLACVLLGIFALGLASSTEQAPSGRVTANAATDNRDNTNANARDNAGGGDDDRDNAGGDGRDNANGGDDGRDNANARGGENGGRDGEGDGEGDGEKGDRSDSDGGLDVGDGPGINGGEDGNRAAERGPNAAATLGKAGILDVPGLTPPTNRLPGRGGRTPQQSKRRGRYGPAGHSTNGPASGFSNSPTADSKTGAATTRGAGDSATGSARRSDPPASQRSAGYLGQSAEIPTGAQRSLETPQVALTFDDGPDAATPRILDLLQQYGVKATFCVIGVSVQAHPEMVQRIVAEGHTLCNHTWRHDLRLGSRSPDEIRADLQRTMDEIHRAVPNAPVAYFRHPGGNFTAASGAVASSLGMASLGWSVDPRDWDLQRSGPGQPLVDRIVAVVQGQCHPGSIVLSHDGGNDRSSTVAAYQTLLPWLKARYDLIALPA